MSKRTQNCRHLKAEMHRFLTVAAVAQMYLPSIAALISSPAVLKSSMDRGLTLQTWSLTQTLRNKLQRLQSGECRGQKTSNSHKMILSTLSKFRMVSERWAVALSCCQTLTWPVRDKLHPARPDDEQIIKGIVDINADLPASSTIHFTTSPFSSMSQTNLCHHLVSNMLPCLLDTMAPRRCHILKIGVGWKGYHLSSLSRSGARHFCLQMVAILSTFWHPCRLGISQY